jgi:thioesterase domain-containing protein
MARQLQDRGERVALLILFDTIVPDSFKRLSLAQRILQHWQSVRHSGTNYITQKIRGKAYQLIRKRKQSSNHRNKLLLEKPAPAIVVRADADDPGLQMLSDNIQMAEKYLQELPTYSGKVTFFQALEQPLGQGWYIDEKFGWGKFAVGEWESHLISGNHKTMFHEPHVQKLGETLKSCLDSLP